MIPIEIESLSFAYPDGQAALRGVSLRIEAGETMGILGANGAGKSTLLLHLNGLLRGRGRIRIGDRELGPRTLPEIRRRVGLVFQDPDDQLFMPRVWDDIAFGPLNQGLPPEQVARQVASALEIVGMAHAADRAPHHLSLGQKKRVALATVLAMECDALVLDEPTAGLDPRGRRELVGFLIGLPQTKVLATHDLELAAEACARVAVLAEGRVVAVGPPAEVLADAGLMEATGLEVPHSLRYHAHEVPHQHWAARTGTTYCEERSSATEGE